MRKFICWFSFNLGLSKWCCFIFRCFNSNWIFIRFFHFNRFIAYFFCFNLYRLFSLSFLSFNFNSNFWWGLNFLWGHWILFLFFRPWYWWALNDNILTMIASSLMSMHALTKYLIFFLALNLTSKYWIFLIF